MHYSARAPVSVQGYPFVCLALSIVLFGQVCTATSVLESNQLQGQYRSRPFSKAGRLLCNCTGLSCPRAHESSFYADGICVTSGGACQKTVSKDASGQLVVDLHCLSGDDWNIIPGRRSAFCEVSGQRSHEHSTGCCDTHDFCNQDLEVVLSPSPVEAVTATPTPDYKRQLETWQIVAIACLAALVACFLVVLIMSRLRPSTNNLTVLVNCPDSRRDESSKQPLMSGSEMMSLSGMGSGPISAVEVTSGSGAGMPLLVPRTVARQIQLKEAIGQGRFAEVYRGVYKGENVAVKIFPSREEASWIREVDVYTTTMLSHENVLGFVAADNKDSIISMQLWLITDYHCNGALYDYLTEHTLDVPTMLRMAKGIASGVVHLHVEVIGTHYKPAIAHRDLKSKNVLVKADLTCCVGDLGLAVKYDSAKREINLPNNNKVGTKRYLPPEILDNSMNPNVFEAYTRADIYSLGLVLWELCRRTVTKNDAGEMVCEGFDLPFYDQVQPDPSLEEMKACVCDQGQRPHIPERWLKHPVLEVMTRLMRECWAARPDARLTALRVRETISAQCVAVEAAAKAEQRKQPATTTATITVESEEPAAAMKSIL